MNIANLFPILKNLSHADKLKAIEFLTIEINQEQGEITGRSTFGGDLQTTPTQNISIEQSNVVVLNTDDYHKIMEELEELEELRAYDEALAANDEAIPFEQAIWEN